MKLPTPLLILLPLLASVGCSRPETAPQASVEDSLDITRWFDRVNGLEPGPIEEQLFCVLEIFHENQDLDTAELGLEILRKFPHHPRSEQVLITTCEALCGRGFVQRAIQLLEEARVRQDAPSGALLMCLADAYALDFRTELAVGTYDEIGSSNQSPQLRSWARLMAAYTKLYGGREMEAMVELNDLSIEYRASGDPELVKFAIAAESQLEIARQWKVTQGR